jgi:hypothetical protein
LTPITVWLRHFLKFDREHVEKLGFVANFFIASMLCSPAGKKSIFLTQGVACRLRYLNPFAGDVTAKRHSPIKLTKALRLSLHSWFFSLSVYVCEKSAYSLGLKLLNHDSADVGD